MKHLLRSESGRLSVLGYVAVGALALVPPFVVAGALDWPDWFELILSVVWIVAVSTWARRALGVRI